MKKQHLAITWLGIEALYLALALRMWWVCDDAWISFRYAYHFANGNGLRYNLGEQVPVEGYSNFLWTVIAAAVERAQGDPGLWMPLLSLFCGGVLVFYAPKAA